MLKCADHSLLCYDPLSQVPGSGAAVGPELAEPHGDCHGGSLVRGHRRRVSGDRLHVGGVLLLEHHSGDGVRQVRRGLGGNDHLGPRVSQIALILASC